MTTLDPSYVAGGGDGDGSGCGQSAGFGGVSSATSPRVGVFFGGEDAKGDNGKGLPAVFMTDAGDESPRGVGSVWTTFTCLTIPAFDCVTCTMASWSSPFCVATRHAGSSRTANSTRGEDASMVSGVKQRRWGCFVFLVRSLAQSARTHNTG